MDVYYKEQATKKLNLIKSNLPLYIQCGFDDYINTVSKQNTKEMNEDELDRYKIKIKKCKEDFKRM